MFNFLKSTPKDIQVCCDFCGSDDTAILYNKARYDMQIHNVICKKCGLVYINPRPDEKIIRDFYKSKYREIYSNTQQVTEKALEDTQHRANQHIEYLRPYLQNGQKILDIGCSAGNFLKTVRENYSNCDLDGIEANIAFSNYGREKYKINIFNGMLEDYNPGITYDLIYISHVLEHFSSPKRALSLISNLLDENKYLFIEVPTIFFPYVKLDFFFQDAHLYTFSPNSISNLLIYNDFEVEKIESVEWFMRIIARKSQNVIKKYTYDKYYDIYKHIHEFKHQ